MIWHNATVEEVSLELGTNTSLGLTSTEAELRLKEFGNNQFKIENKRGLFKLLISGLTNFVNITLIIIALINFVLALAVDLNNKYENILIIATALFMSLLISLLKYFSERMLEKSLGDSTTNVTVIRNGEEVIINSSLLVPGDIMLIKAGDYIKADGRLVDSYALTCDESLISGDSAPNEKIHNTLLDDITPLINRHNMVYNGSTVLNGRGTVIVTETAFLTELGKRKDIQIQLENPETPLLIRLNRIKKLANTVAVWAAIITFIIGIAVNFTNTSVSFAVTVSSSLLLAFSLYFAVGINLIPHLLTFSKAFAVFRMKKKGIVLNSNNIAEELKDISVICTDKTGVLTTEEHTVVKVFTGNNITVLDETKGDESVAALLRLSLICSNFSRIEHGEKHTNNIERSIENASINYIGISKTDVDGLYPKIAELPFDSDRMLMTTVTAINGNPVSITKGAPEIVLSRCYNVDTDTLHNVINGFAKEGLKVIALAIKQLDEIPANPNFDELENELTFVGILGIEDRIAPKAAKVCIEAAKSGIKTIMVTGDHIDTAIAISKNAGIISSDEEAISGEDLALLTDKELEENISNYSVFARISSEDKLRIVKALKANGQKVLLTGDSLNDSAALLEADIGCALGYTASDIVKDSSDLILENNHYSSIIFAIKESSKIFSNIKKSLAYLFAFNISLVILTVLGILIFGSSPLTAVAVLQLSVIILVCPLLSIYIDDSDYTIKPNENHTSLMPKQFLLKLIIPTIFTTLVALVSYGMNLGLGYQSAKGAAFIVLFFGLIAQALCVLLNGSILSDSIIKQKFSLLVLIIPVFVLMILILTSFSASITISGSGWIFCLISFVLVLISHEIIKLISKV